MLGCFSRATLDRILDGVWIAAQLDGTLYTKQQNIAWVRGGQMITVAV
jgi:hypothetical protein